MQTTTTLKYFAYGSNMHPLRLRQRVPSCRPLGIAKLGGYTLRFHKRGQDGSGKCNILYTGRGPDQVIGVVYAMEAIEKPRLDRAEGLGKGYEEVTLNILIEDNEQMVFCYQAQPNYIDDTLKPFSWYKELVLGGSRAHRLPEAYVRQLELLEALPDADRARTAMHLRILSAYDGLPITRPETGI